MDKYYVLVTGSGTTSRANLEALMEDHFYANDRDGQGVVLLAYEEKPSQGQTFAAQLAKDKGKDIIVLTTEAGRFDGLPGASVKVEAEPIKAASKMMAGERSVAFILWSDEDEECIDTLSHCKGVSVPCFNLTDGLNALNSPEDLKPSVKPIIPKAETIKEAEEEPVDGEDEEEEDDDEDEEDDEEEDELADDIYYGIQALVQAIAKAVVAELQKAQDEASKDPKK
jgi:hypothetical protein